MPKELRDKSPTIEWKKIAGLRDVLIHEYLGVDLEKVWLVVENRLPCLKKDLSKMIK